MKTLVLFIILIAVSGMVYTMEPSAPPPVQSPYIEKVIKNEPVKVFDSQIPDWLKIRIENLENGSPLSADDIPLDAPIPPVNLNDSIALVALYRATNGPEWTNNDGWLTGRVGTWFGITVGSGRVTGINLYDNNLQGIIHDSIGYLTSLYSLNLSNNSLTGTVPEEIGNIPYLLTLYLSSNQLSGNLFDLLTLQTYLKKIDISYNQFSGDIPDDFGSFSYLNELHINDNQFIFKDIEPIFDWGNFSNFSSAFTYSPQAEVGVEDTIEIDKGDPFHIGISGYEPGEYDQYLWYKDFEPLVEVTDTIIDVLSATAQDAGIYYCLISNTMAEELTLASHYIYVNIINHPPVADAGPDQPDVDEGASVTLDGSLSSEPDSDPLTFQWRAPVEITLDDSTISNPTFTAPEVTDTTTFIITLVVNDGTDYSLRDTVLITVNQINKAPVAIAGDDQYVNEGDGVSLDGSASYDPDKDPLYYSWSSPEGIELDDSTLSNPNFTAPDITSDTTLTFILVVNDGYLNSDPDTVLVYVYVPNQIPVAVAGLDQEVNEGTLVTLDGSGSFDPDSDSLYFSWSHPAEITLSDSTAIEPTFTAPQVNKDTTFVFVLVVDDGSDSSDPDTLLVKVLQVNIPPVADAGLDSTWIEGDVVPLDGSYSFDPDGDTLYYSWRSPTGIVLDDSTKIQPIFTAPEVTKDTTYLFELVVFDGTEYSAPDTVLITILNVFAVPETLAVQNVNIGSLQTECYDALQTITVAGGSTTVYFQSGSTVNLIAGQKISFLPGFHAYSGSIMHAYISTAFCEPPGDVVQPDPLIKSLDISQNSPEKNRISEAKCVKVYPNPNDGRFTIELSNFDAPVQLSIINTLGTVVFNKTSLLGENPLLDISHLNKGLYFVKVRSNNFMQTQKIIIK